MRGSAKVVTLISSIVLCVGCGGSNSAGERAIYPEEYRTNFLSSCILNASDSGVSQSVADSTCRCLLGKLEERYSLEEFVEAEEELISGGASGIDFAGLIGECDLG